MPDMDDKVCVNHPEVAAESRCTTCFKPVCSGCIENRDGHDFCSNLCAAKFFATNKGVGEFIQKDRKRQFLARSKKAALILGLLILGMIIFVYWTRNKETVQKISDQLKDKANELRETK